MARFSSFLGRRVRVHYLAAASPVPSVGVLVGDTGRAIFLEDPVAQRSTLKQLRWEIPYHCIAGLDHDDEPLVDAQPAAE